jgi:hypothetical protein
MASRDNALLRRWVTTAEGSRAPISTPGAARRAKCEAPRGLRGRAARRSPV